MAVLFGIALALAGERGKPVLNLLDALTVPVFKLVQMLMKMALSVHSERLRSRLVSMELIHW